MAHNDRHSINVNNKGLISNTVVASNSIVKSVNNHVINSNNADMSLSPTIIIPLRNNTDESFRVRALLDSGSGTNWITASLLKFVAHKVIGSDILEVITFSGSVTKKFPLVEVYYKDLNNTTWSLLCYVHDTFTRHTSAKGMVNFIVNNSKIKYDYFDSLVDPASLDVDHSKESLGIGIILCSSSINRIRTKGNVIQIPELEILLEPTIFGVAISGAIPPCLQAEANIFLANKISPRLVCKRKVEDQVTDLQDNKLNLKTLKSDNDKLKITLHDTRIQLGVRQHYSTEITKENEKLKSKLQNLSQSFEQLQNELSWAYQDKSMLRDKCTNLEKEVNSLTLTNINFGKELQLSKEQCLKQQINNSEEKYYDCQEHMDILKTNDVANCNQDTIQNSDSSIISHSKVVTTGVSDNLANKDEFEWNEDPQPPGTNG